MRKTAFIAGLFFLVSFLVLSQMMAFPRAVQAQTSTPQPEQVIIYLFWGDGCPHCAAAEPMLKRIAQRYPNVELREYEVFYSPENRELLQKMAAEFGFEATGVPTIFVGERHWQGWSDQFAKEVENAVQTCVTSGCSDKGAEIFSSVNANALKKLQSGVTTPISDVIDIPLIGAVELSTKSLWISTALIAFVDGVNPCSIWVLTMLIAITLHTGSRKKVVIIGLIFLTVTASIYALFIAGLFTMFTVINFVGWIQVVVALVALFFGLINIKDYFWYKEGLSFTIADDKKPGIYQRMRKVMDASQSFWGLAGATVVMAAGVSLVEFSCTAGFPVLWTNLLVSQNVPPLTFVLLLLLYLVIYQVDEMAIFFTAVFTLKSSKLEEKHGRILKLIGGMLMLALAGVMLVNPALMSKISSSLVVFGIAFAATLLVLLVHRVILPSFGVYIGTELGPSGKK